MFFPCGNITIYSSVFNGHAYVHANLNRKARGNPLVDCVSMCMHLWKKSVQNTSKNPLIVD